MNGAWRSDSTPDPDAPSLERDALSDEARARAFDPVVVYAPLRYDGPALAELLSRDGLSVCLCQTLDDLADAMRSPAGMFVFTQEAFSADMLAVMRPWLKRQEAWSEPPILALLDPRQHGRSRAAHLKEALPNATILVLERPVRALEFLSSVRISLGTRARQLDLRDQLVLQADLLRELSHRVKNALANVYAVYRLTYRHAKNLEGFGKVFEARLQALVRVHQVLTTSGWQGADLRVIAEDTLRPYAALPDEAAGRGRVHLSGPSVPLPPRQALAAALTLHELAVNAATHGALQAEDGHIDLDWRLDARGEHPVLSLRWAERGGPTVQAPEGDGFGTTFIRSTLAAERDGDVQFDFSPAGLRCKLAFGLERAV